MARTDKRWAAPLALVGVLLGVLAAGLSAQTAGEPQRYTATAVLGGGRGTTALEIVIDRWSTQADRNRLISVLEQGQDKLLDALKDAPKVGYIRNPMSIAWDLHFAQRAVLPDGGEQITVATDRPVGFWEEANQARTLDYPFTIVTLKVNTEGEGDGTMALAAKLTADKNSNSIVVENFGLQPIKLEAVKRAKLSH